MAHNFSHALFWVHVLASATACGKSDSPSGLPSPEAVVDEWRTISERRLEGEPEVMRHVSVTNVLWNQVLQCPDGSGPMRHEWPLYPISVWQDFAYGNLRKVTGPEGTAGRVEMAGLNPSQATELTFSEGQRVADCGVGEAFKILRTQIVWRFTRGSSTIDDLEFACFVSIDGAWYLMARFCTEAQSRLVF